MEQGHRRLWIFVSAGLGLAIMSALARAQPDCRAHCEAGLQDCKHQCEGGDDAEPCIHSCQVLYEHCLTACE